MTTEYNYRSMTRFQVGQMPQDELDRAERHMDDVLNQMDFDDPDWDSAVNFAVMVENEQDLRYPDTEGMDTDIPRDQLDYEHNQPEATYSEGLYQLGCRPPHDQADVEMYAR